MASESYGDAILISRPQYDAKFRVWRPYASITLNRYSGMFHYHQIKGIEESFATEDEAISFGLMLARKWVDAYREL